MSPRRQAPALLFFSSAAGRVGFLRRRASRGGAAHALRRSAAATRKRCANRRRAETADRSPAKRRVTSQALLHVSGQCANVLARSARAHRQRKSQCLRRLIPARTRKKPAQTFCRLPRPQRRHSTAAGGLWSMSFDPSFWPWCLPSASNCWPCALKRGALKRLDVFLNCAAFTLRALVEHADAAEPANH